MQGLVLSSLLLLVSGSAGLQAQPAPRPLFVPLENSGLDFEHFNGWSGEYYLPEISCGGGALFDYDNDGDLDLYLVQGAELAPKKAAGGGEDGATEAPAPRGDRLYRNDLGRGDEDPGVPRFVDVTAESGLRTAGYGCGVASGDFDGDGWSDLYVTRLGSNQLWRNGRDGTFSDVTAKSGSDDPRWSTSASFADIDRDGHLDLYVANYVDFSLAEHKTCRTAAGAPDYCDPASYRGVPDTLLRNRGDGTFEDISLRAGIQRQRSKSLGVVAADFTGDSRLDFYVTNDGVANQLWVQQGDGRFVDEALLAGCAVNGRGQAEASMGVAAADFDRDLDLDLFMTHLNGETNTLFLNDGQGGFNDRTIALGLGSPSWPMTGWGTAWIDADNDGRLDLLVVNGAVRSLEELARRGDPFPFHQTNQLFLQREDGRFSEVSAVAGPVFEQSDTSRGLAVGDLDNDGDLDALVINNHGPARLWINVAGQDHHWLGLHLLDRDGRLAIGAEATLEQRDRRQLLHVHTDGSFASARDPRLLFGLGRDDSAPRLRVRWPDGQVETWDRLPLDRYSTLRQRSGRTEP